MIAQSTKEVKPHPDEPGTLGEQIGAVIVSLMLAQRHGTTAAEQWQRARQIAIPHVRGRRDAQGRPIERGDR